MLSCNIFWPLHFGLHLCELSALICMAFFLEVATINILYPSSRSCACAGLGADHPLSSQQEALQQLHGAHSETR